MALVTTTVTPEIRITPFTGVSEGVRERSGIARAEVAYTSYGKQLRQVIIDLFHSHIT
jgi:hypothetical protein